jgi:hypothetical protein
MNFLSFVQQSNVITLNTFNINNINQLMNWFYHKKQDKIVVTKNLYLCTYNFEQACNSQQRTTIDKMLLLKRY